MLRNARREQRHWYIGPTPYYYWYDGTPYYFGRPGFYRGRYNGGSIGPCWTQTPIGPVWTAGECALSADDASAFRAMTAKKGMNNE